MLIDQKDLSNNTKVWVYQCDRPFSFDEAQTIKQTLTTFVNEWESHGKPVTGAYQIVDNQFIVLFGDLSHNEVSGCSIDSSVTQIRQLESTLNISLLDKSKVAFKTTEGAVKVVDFRQLKELTTSEAIKPTTLVFDNSVDNLDDYKTKWLAPATDTWLKRYFN